jgi:DNA-binding response OmpR family regulator
LDESAAGTHKTSKTDNTMTKTVLLIAPEAEQGATLEVLFEKSVWEVWYARDNEEALEKAKEEAFDLIVTNAATTGREDVVLLRRLRSCGHARG